MDRKDNIWLNIGFVFAIALVFKLFFFRLPEVLAPDLLFIALFVFIIWYGNLTIDAWLNLRYSWIKDFNKRLVFQSLAGLVFTVLVMFCAMFLIHQIQFGDGVIINRKMREIFTPALLFTLCLLAFNISGQFLKAWRKSLMEVEKYKTESATAQLQNLKNQLNPHFLFNNLSVLTSLVYKNQDKAVEFINELSKVYRYVLENRNTELVALQEELTFLHHYIYLLKIRFEGSIAFDIAIEEEKKNSLLLPMCLQTLVENTIQHNESSQANPLKVSIYTQGDFLVVENPVQPRNEAAESSKTGLKNIKLRYSFFTDQKIVVNDDGGVFQVILPLITKQ
jgi:LytS/YehU family sensor histidine kinase